MEVQCELCPKQCVIKPGESGDCRIRVNLDGKLLAVTYGYPCALHVDPVEKKPMFHFLPGSNAFSIATAGCNLHCLNCQNWEISQSAPDTVPAHEVPPKKIVSLAKQYKCQSIAYTYSDPVVFYEYTLDTSRLARQAGLKNILVTAGYINRKPFWELCKVTDAANIDLKGITDDFYRKMCSATLKPVQESLVTAKNAGIIVEVTNLILPTLNDSDSQLRALSRWIKENMGIDTPLHFSRFQPRYRMRDLPPTSEETLARARSIALAEGLKFVYVGNLLNPDWSGTCCPGCGKLLIRRSGFRILENQVKNGLCPHCKTKIYGVWQ